MRFLFVKCLMGLGLLLPWCSWAETVTDDVRYLANEHVKVGVNLAIGGSITHFGPADEDVNLINSHDWGRQVQMSFYSGPIPYTPNGKQPTDTWRPLGWNPIQSGDCFGNPAEVLEFRAEEDGFYLHTRPLHWPLNDEPCECTFEVWIELEGATARVRSKLNMDRSDTTPYPARQQELPAIYTNGPYHRLMTYSGDAPYSGAELTEIEKWTGEGLRWFPFLATEHWAALVNDEGYGVGVWHPRMVSFLGGFAGKWGKGGPKDAPTGYMTPLAREHLDHNIEYDYEYRLILGTLEEIRAHVYDHADRGLPRWDFHDTRAGAHRQGMGDKGWPIGATWELSVEEPGAALVGPVTFWRAEDALTLVVQAAFPEDSGARVCWRPHGSEGFADEHCVPLGEGRGRVHRYALDLSEAPGYEGGMVQWRIAFDAPPGSPIEMRRVVLYEQDPIAKWRQLHEERRMRNAFRRGFGSRHRGVRGSLR